MTNREAGINVVREMMVDQAAAKLSASADSNTFGAPIAAYAVDQVFADIWTRPGLDRRSRSLVSMSVMIATPLRGKRHGFRGRRTNSR
jgi:4-carboxymuconolactone decarboxylase